MSRSAELLLLLALVPALAARDEPPPERLGAADAAPLLTGRDEVLVRVGDVPIHASDVYRVLDLATPVESQQALRQLILQVLGRKSAEAEGIDVAIEDLIEATDAALDEQRARFAEESDGSLDLEEFVAARYGLTPDAHREAVQQMVLTSMLLERAVRLDQRRMDRDEVALILVEDEGLARQIGAQLAEGASFSVLARRHSVHPSGASGGGLAPLPREARSPIAAGREALEPGEVLGPEPIDLGGEVFWRLLRLVARPDGTDAPWTELRDEIETGLVVQPLRPEELTVFEDRALARYRVSLPSPGP